jgi:hypothetical protein
MPLAAAITSRYGHAPSKPRASATRPGSVTPAAPYFLWKARHGYVNLP